MSIKVGDRVVMLCDHVPGVRDKKIVRGSIGIVQLIPEERNSYTIAVKTYSKRSGHVEDEWSFGRDDFEIFEDHFDKMPSPDMSLDEIHEAEKLMELSHDQKWTI